VNVRERGGALGTIAGKKACFSGSANAMSISSIYGKQEKALDRLKD